MRVSTLHTYVEALGGRLRLLVEHEAGLTQVELPSRDSHPDGPRREYRVIWQDSDTRRLIPVGWLEFTGEEFAFSYTNEARAEPSFKPFPSFPSLEETYRSRELFAFFSVRLASTADPQYEAILEALGLTREQATPAELLARSPSESPHDTIQVVPEPLELPDGALVRTFLASGVRHIHEEDPQRTEGTIASLTPGTPLDLVPEPDNPTNSRAQLLVATGTRVGWVPDYLLDEIQAHRAANRAISCVVERANGPDVPWHLRLLCRITAEARPGRGQTP